MLDFSDAFDRMTIDFFPLALTEFISFLFFQNTKSRCNSDEILSSVGGLSKVLEGKLSPLQALFSPPGLQQMQQFLQQVANNGNGNSAFNPAQLHHLMQQQQQNFLSHHQVSFKASKIEIAYTFEGIEWHHMIVLLAAIGRCGSQTIGTVDAPATGAVANQSLATDPSYADKLFCWGKQ